MDYAQTVLFAVQAGLRLYGASRKAYADSARGHALSLPLPRAPGVRVDTAESWFLTSPEGGRILNQTPRIRWLIEQPSRSESQNVELTDLYLFYWTAANPRGEEAEVTRGEVSDDEMSALLEVRQWSDAEASGMATPLQTITGTLVNVAIDYFVQTPGAIKEERPQGRALLAFLRAMDGTDFAAVPPREIATGIMVAVLDTVSAHPRLLCGGENEEKLIAGVSASLAESAATFLRDATDKERREAGVWLQLIGHAVLRGAAETVLAEPGRYLHVEPGAESGVVVEVGTTIVDLLLGDRRLAFRRLLSAEGLRKVTASALAAVARNPDILKIDHQGVKTILVALADDLSKVKGPISTDLFPEIARLVLEKSAGHLDLLWGPSFQSPERHLLVTATRVLLRSLAKEPPQGSAWTPRLTPDQIIGLADAVLDEVVDNPAWLLDEAGGESGYLEAALEAVLASLRKVPGSRISAETGVAVLRAGLGAAALRLDLLGDLPAEAGRPARTAVTAALDAIFEEIFDRGVDPGARWDLARNATLRTLAEIALGRLARFGAGEEEIARLRRAVRELLAQENPFDPDAFTARLDRLLSGSA